MQTSNTSVLTIRLPNDQYERLKILAGIAASASTD